MIEERGLNLRVVDGVGRGIALDRDGNEFVLEADELLARCICHENDHLDGILFIDKSVDGKVYRVEDDDEEEE